MAISSPRRIDDLLETACLRSILSSLGRNKHAPALQGPGFPLHEPSVKPQTTSLSAERICSSMIVLASSSQLIRFARVCSNVDDFNNRNLFLTAKLLKQGYRYHKIRKAFSKFYYRHSELIVKYNIGLKTLLQQGISEPIFYGDLVYKFKRIVRKPNFSDQFKKIVKRYIRVGYNLDIMRQSACLVLNPITVYSYGFLFNCTTVGQASDSMTALT